MSTYLKRYSGETQWKSLEVTFDLEYDSDDEQEDLRAHQIQAGHKIIDHHLFHIGNYVELSLCKFYIPCGEESNLDKAI